MIDLDSLKSTVSICDAWHRLGLEGNPAPGKCLSSPFRPDRHPSFSISTCGKFWKDHGTDEKGDVLTFAAKATGKDFKDVLAWLAGPQNAPRPTVKPRAAQSKPKGATNRKPLSLPEIDKGSIDELAQLARLRGFEGFFGIQRAADTGHFGFTEYHGQRCWITYDGPGQAAQVRPLDGQPFANGAKALTLPGSNASFPLGASSITEAIKTIYLTEGTGDWLTAFTLHAFETPLDWTAVSMLGAAQRIDEAALDLFKAKQVIIYGQNDEPGLRAARTWAAQLKEIAASVSAKVPDMPGADLNDTYAEELEGGQDA